MDASKLPFSGMLRDRVRALSLGATTLPCRDDVLYLHVSTLHLIHAEMTAITHSRKASKIFSDDANPHQR